MENVRRYVPRTRRRVSTVARKQSVSGKRNFRQIITSQIAICIIVGSILGGIKSMNTDLSRTISYAIQNALSQDVDLNYVWDSTKATYAKIMGHGE